MTGNNALQNGGGRRRGSSKKRLLCLKIADLSEKRATKFFRRVNGEFVSEFHNVDDRTPGPHDTPQAGLGNGIPPVHRVKPRQYIEMVITTTPRGMARCF
jgi:hypothetical protein